VSTTYNNGARMAKIRHDVKFIFVVAICIFFWFTESASKLEQ